MNTELIQSVNPVIPTKGSNAGKQMFVINNKHWAKDEPKNTDTHVVLEDIDVEVTPAFTDPETGAVTAAVVKTYTNVIGYTTDTRMSVDQKLAKLMSLPAEYSQAVAYLLK